MNTSWRIALLALLVVALAASACSSDNDDRIDAGDGDSENSQPGPVTLTTLEVTDRTAPSGDPQVAGQAIAAFSDQLFAAARAQSPGENLSLSATSIAAALAMIEPGATGDAQTQIRDLLGIEDPVAFHAAFNALEQDLEARVPQDFGSESDPGELELRLVNAAYLQQGYPFEATYLDAVGNNYGPVLNTVDFSAEPDAVAHEINAFVAEATSDRIPELIADGVITPDTVFAIVNALYLNASWLSPFSETETRDDIFTLVDGTEVTVPMMSARSDRSSQGDGWIGARKQLTGQIYAEFILPDEDRFDEIADDLSRVSADWSTLSSSGSTLTMPRFETRSSTALNPVLQALGLTAPYAKGNLMGIAPDPDLVIDKVLHESFVSIDEEGIEAAASTVVLGEATSAPMAEPVPVVLDRAFIYRIVDQQTGATLFVGQMLNPAG